MLCSLLQEIPAYAGMTALLYLQRMCKIMSAKLANTHPLLYHRSMKILVTGGCGFIGSHVVDALIARGDAVTVLDDLSTGTRAHLNPAATLMECDVAYAANVTPLAAEVDAIIHLAAIASVAICEQAPDRAAQTNIGGTKAVFDAALASNIPVIYASSAAVYGDNPHLPLGEDADPKPLGHYGTQKLDNENLALFYHSRVPSVGLRFFNVYGPRQDAASPYSGVISTFLARARAGKALTFFGDGEQTRDFIYVGDVVRLVLAALDHARSHSGALIVNGCTGRATSLKHLVSTLEQLQGGTLRREHGPIREGDIRHSLGDPSRAQTALGFVASTSLEDGLRALVAHA